MGAPHRSSLRHAKVLPNHLLVCQLVAKETRLPAMTGQMLMGLHLTCNTAEMEIPQPAMTTMNHAS